MKNKYDSSVVFLYSMGKENLLPPNFRKQIPYSTISDWRRTNVETYVGHEFRHFFTESIGSAELKLQLMASRQALWSLSRAWITLSHLLLPWVKSLSRRSHL